MAKRTVADIETAVFARITMLKAEIATLTQRLDKAAQVVKTQNQRLEILERRSKAAAIAYRRASDTSSVKAH